MYRSALWHVHGTTALLYTVQPTVAPRYQSEYWLT